MTFHIDQVANSYGWNQSYWGEGELVSDKEGGGKEEGEFIPTPTAHPHPGQTIKIARRVRWRM